MRQIVFVHGMFQTPKSWGNWIGHFSARGFACLAPAWPLHEGEPRLLRADPPPGLGKLTFAEVVLAVEKAIAGLDRPIMIGHSVGGLVTQVLLNRGLISAGIAISSVAPNAMLDFDWGFIRNSAVIANPLKGDDPVCMDAETFHGSFANTLSEAAATAAFDDLATHDSRNVLRGCMGPDGRIDLAAPHGPLLLIGGEADEIIPGDLTRKIYDAYADNGSVTTLKVFAGRSHFICNEPGWDEVASFAELWLKAQFGVAAAQA